MMTEKEGQCYAQLLLTPLSSTPSNNGPVMLMLNPSAELILFLIVVTQLVENVANTQRHMTRRL